MKRKIIILSMILVLIACINITYAQGKNQVEVKIPEFNVEINGSLIDNKYNQYPMIMHKDITYLPLTDGYCNALGLYTSLDEEGFKIAYDYKIYDAPKQILSSANDLNSEYTAEIYSGKIIIKGEEIKNSEEEYPILYFKDTVYIPLTWRFANMFYWSLYWDDEDGLSVVGRIPEVYEFVVNDDWVFYNEDFDLFKIRVDGSEKTYFADINSATDIHVVDDWIYYRNLRDESKLYRIKIDGTNKTMLSDQEVYGILGIGDWIYYKVRENDSYDINYYIYKMKLDGSENTKIENMQSIFERYPLIKDNWIYYTNIDDNKNLYKIKTDGSGQMKLSDDWGTKLQVSDGWLYYIDGNSHLKTVKLNGSNNSKLLDEKVSFYVVKGEWIYYSNEKDKGKLYKIKVDGLNKEKLNNDESWIVGIANEWVYYEEPYGFGGYFLKLARTNVNTGVTENILPKRQVKYYYINGEKADKDSAGDLFVKNLKLSNYEINDDLSASIEIPQTSISSPLRLVKNASDYKNSYSDIYLLEVDIDVEKEVLIHSRNKEEALITKLEANEKYSKWQEVYRDNDEYYTDIYAYDMVNNEKFKVKEKVNCSFEGGFYRIHTTLYDNYISWIEHHKDEKKTYIKLYDLTNNKEKTLAKINFLNEDGFLKYPVTFVDINEGKIIYDVKSNNGKYRYYIYDIDKKRVIKKVNVNSKAVVHLSGDYDSENDILGVYFIGKTKDGYFEELGYVDLKEKDYDKILRLEENEYIYNDRIQIENGYLAYNIQKNISGYIFDHYFGYIFDLKNKETKEFEGSFEIKLKGNHVGNLSFDKETNAKTTNYELLNIEKIFSEEVSE